MHFGGRGWGCNAVRGCGGVGVVDVDRMVHYRRIDPIRARSRTSCLFSAMLTVQIVNVVVLRKGEMYSGASCESEKFQ